MTIFFKVVLFVSRNVWWARKDIVMKFIGIGMIWIGFGLAVAGVAFGTGDGDAVLGVGVVGVICAMFATIALARNN